MMHKVLLSCAAVALTLIPVSSSAQPTTQVAFKDNINLQHWARGTYEYIKGDSGKWRGEDEWMLSVAKDGTRTMRMFSLVQETGAMRDVTHRVDANFRPMETFTLTYHNGVRTGTGLFVFDGDKGRGLVQSPHGVLTQEVDIPGFFAMVPHSMASDGWYFGQYDRKKGGLQHVRLFNPHGLGNTNGSVLARVQTAPIRLIGPERITVPAGTFNTEKWEIVNGGANNDDKYTVWVYGEDRIMIKLIDHPRDLVYNLTSYTTSRK